MAKEKYNSMKLEKVKIGEIGDPSHGEDSLNGLIENMARTEARRRKRETFKDHKERINGEKMEDTKKKKLSKQAKALLKATGKLKVDNLFEYKTPEEVFEEYRVQIFESMKRNFSLNSSKWPPSLKCFSKSSLGRFFFKVVTKKNLRSALASSIDASYMYFNTL